MDSKKVKELLFSLGADLCKIADLSRFSDANDSPLRTSVYMKLDL